LIGKIVQLAPNYYSIEDVNSVRIIYGHGTEFVKSEWYDAFTFHPDLSFANIFSERSVALHAAKRRKLASMYSMSSLVSYEKYVDECVEILYKRLEEFADQGNNIGLGHWLQCYAFDVIGNIMV
jgi:hypothetical protein